MKQIVLRQLSQFNYYFSPMHLIEYDISELQTLSTTPAVASSVFLNGNFVLENLTQPQRTRGLFHWAQPQESSPAVLHARETLHAFSHLSIRRSLRHSSNNPPNIRLRGSRSDGLFIAAFARRRPSSHSHLTGEVYGGVRNLHLPSRAWRPRFRMHGRESCSSLLSLSTLRFQRILVTLCRVIQKLISWRSGLRSTPNGSCCAASLRRSRLLPKSHNFCQSMCFCYVLLAIMIFCALSRETLF